MNVDPLEVLRVLGQASAVSYTREQLDGSFAEVVALAGALDDAERQEIQRRVAELVRKPVRSRRRRLRWEKYQGRCERLAGAPPSHVLLRGYLRSLGHGPAAVRRVREKWSS